MAKLGGGTGSGEGASTVANAAKPSIDALEMRISEFRYDPEDDCTFELWFERYRDIFEHETQDMAASARVRLLLRHLCTRDRAQYVDAVAPTDVFEREFDDTVKDLN